MPGFVHLAGLARLCRAVSAPGTAGVPTGSTLRRMDGAAGVLSRWPWRLADGMPQAFDSAASRCTPPARPCAGLRPSGCVWSGHGLPCASAAWPVPVPACRLDAFDRAPGSGAAGGFFRAGLPSVARRQAPRDRGGGLLFRKQPRIVESTAPGGKVHGKSQSDPLQINHLEPSYFSVTCRGKLAEDLWKNCGMTARSGFTGPFWPSYRG